MDLDKNKILNNSTGKSNEKPQNKSDLADNFSENNNSKLIEKEYEALSKNIESIVRDNFLTKEFYENLPD
ncbi:hypothetical protein IKI14_01295 [bacterium]|nr:hypothetical protein [bacterium]